MNEKFQITALHWLGALAFVLLILCALSFQSMITADTPAGTVPTGEGGTFALLMLAFREVLAAIVRLSSNEREAVRDQQIYTSKPETNPAPKPVTQAGQPAEEQQNDGLD